MDRHNYLSCSLQFSMLCDKNEYASESTIFTLSANSYKLLKKDIKTQHSSPLFRITLMDCLKELSTFTLLSCAHFQRKSPEMCLKHMWISTINCVLSSIIQVAKVHYNRAD